MKIKALDQFAHNGNAYVVLHDSIDGPKGHLFCFMGNSSEIKNTREFFSIRKSKITKKNGWVRVNKAAQTKNK